jgi:hypothetical protein
MGMAVCNTPQDLVQVGLQSTVKLQSYISLLSIIVSNSTQVTPSDVGHGSRIQYHSFGKLKDWN